MELAPSEARGAIRHRTMALAFKGLSYWGGCAFQGHVSLCGIQPRYIVSCAAARATRLLTQLMHGLFDASMLGRWRHQNKNIRAVLHESRVAASVSSFPHVHSSAVSERGEV